MNADPATPHPLVRALVEEFAAVMGALLGTTATLAPAAEPVEPAWTVTVTVGEPAPGAVTFGLTAADAARFARIAMGFDEDPDDDAVADMLREVVGQTVGALREKPAGRGVLFAVESPARSGQAPASGGEAHLVTLLPDFSPVIGVWAQLEEGRRPTAAARPSAPPVLPTPASAAAGSPASGTPANLDVILDIDLPLTVRFGQTELTLDALTKLGPGSVIDLRRSPDDPVEVLVNGKLVAHAEVVVVGGNYGVRIIQVVSAADRVRTLGM
jgi:flagellar motor switch protein FliN